MITIDPHGQWPLTVRNFYVVLIMTKLVQLESEGLEYYLLGFDQGGIIKGPTGTSTEGALPQITFPIAFNKPLLALSNMINNSTNPNPNFIDIWTQIRDLQNNSFKMFLQSTGNLYKYDGVYWVAIGL